MTTKTRYTKQAKAIVDLYQTMPKNVQKEIKKIIIGLDTNYDDVETADLTRLSDKSMKDIWDNPENDHWDNFFKSKKYV